MEKENRIVLLDGKKIRLIENSGEWFFSIVDIIHFLTDSTAPRKYWYRLKKRESVLLSVCRQLKMIAIDGRERLTDVSDRSEVFRIMMYVPTLKGESLARWLANELEQIPI